MSHYLVVFFFPPSCFSKTSSCLARFFASMFDLEQYRAQLKVVVFESAA